MGLGLNVLSLLFGRSNIYGKHFIQTFNELGHSYFSSFLPQICALKKLCSHLLLFVINYVSRGREKNQIFSAFVENSYLAIDPDKR